MEANFEILIRKKIPYWSSFLMALIAVCFAFLCLLYFIMIPSDKSSDEMKVAYYILVVPEWLKDFSAYSFVGLLLLIPIYSVSKSYKIGSIKICDECIKINGGGHNKEIPVDTIKRMILNDVKYTFRRPHEAMEIIVFQKANRKTSFLLRHYVQSEEIINALAQFKTIEFSVHEGFALEMHDDDES